MASNGIVHIIDKVILHLTIYELLIGPSNGPFTLLAPNEAAFGNLLTELMVTEVPALIAALGTDGLASVLTYHVVAGNINSDELPSSAVSTVNGDDFRVNLASEVVLTDTQDRTSTVTSVDIQGTNGVGHNINTVILPNLYR